ncbi:MAG: preprotein translocase subunit SecE [Candidatus Calescibacterium sp.]|jgi:preprotein translocase SecE subunit|nr:preprotein translocase subunit SecE [Candidatus Calescibacterium sp.]
MEKIKRFIQEAISETKKVEFPNSEVVRITTIAVISMSFIVAGIIGIIDFIFSRIFKLIF